MGGRQRSKVKMTIRAGCGRYCGTAEVALLDVKSARVVARECWGECAFGGTKPLCESAPVHSMGPKNRRVYAGDFLSAYNGKGESIMFKRIKQLARKQRRPKRRTQPQPEEDLGGGDICSLQEQPSTDDDQPLD